MRESGEMYLETILLINREKGSCRSVDIVEKLGYSKSSVSRGVNILIDKGFLTMAQTGELIFTEKGKEKAEDVYEKHEVLTKTLEMLGVPLDIAEADACKIEHVISEDTFQALKRKVAEAKEKKG